METTPKDLFWNKPLSALVGDLDTDSAAGLGAQEAKRRLAQYGPNTATDVRHQPLWLQFLLRFRNPLIVLLMIASFLSAITGDHAGFAIILSMLVLSVTLDFFQEVRAEKTVDALRQSVAVRAIVLRNGRETELPVRDIVRGDIVLLSPGALVPADGRLISCKDIYVNQALLTGESFPSEKTAADAAAAVHDLSSAANALFMGTSVISGTGMMVVAATGKETRLGGLAGALSHPRPPTDFEQGTQKFGMMIVRVVAVMVLFVLLVNIWFHRSPLESFMFALALAVGLTPELLPMLVTITLARGASRMAKQRVIVKRLPAMHNLGAMDVLCTDKTGTLTEADIRLMSALDAAGCGNSRVFLLAYINSSFETGVKSPLDQAILNHGQPDISLWEKIDEAPFDFERRRVSVLAATGGKRFLIVKGAPEDILKLSAHYESGDGVIAPFDEDARQACLEKFGEYGDQGLRVLAVAFREVDDSHVKAVITDETGLTFSGFVTFLDPPKQSAKDALRGIRDAGIAVKVITGDNERVTRHVCEIIGFDAGEILTGEEMQRLNPEAMAARVESAHVFCRVTPQQKSQIIAALKARGHTVGFLGDGINDAPALRGADVGISVDSAADVAKSAADVILLDRDLSIIHVGVMEGRRAVENTEKYILMGASSNFGNMLSMACAALILPFLPMLPVQILLNNLLYDISQTALPFDNVDADAVAGPTRWNLPLIRHFMWILGPVSSLFDFLTFYVLLKLFPGNETLFHTGWFVESIVTQALIVMSIRTHRFFGGSKPHPLLVAMAVFIAATGMFLPFTPLGAWFHLAPLPPVFFGFLGGALAAYFFLVEVAKRLFRRFVQEAAFPSRNPYTP